MSDKEVRQAVAEQLINMIENNIIEENGGESFVGWCQDGEVFELQGLKQENVAKCMALVEKIAPMVDDITLNYLNIDNI